MTASKLILSAASGAKADPGPDIDEIFSTYTYVGNGGTQSIVNGIDLANEGGMLWIAQRDIAYVPILTDSTMTRGQRLGPNNDGGINNNAPYNITALNNNGFSLSDNSDGVYGVNGAPSGSAAGADGTYASWTFRKAEKFFDIVTYTGNGSNRAISHNLGTAPGMMWIKKTSGSQNWAVYHRGSNGGSNPEDYYYRLNQNIAQVNDTNQFQSTAPTSTQFFLGTDSDTNQNTATYVAYLFAHNNNDGGFGEDGDKDVIKCGYYNGNGSSTGPEINLGFEPQWVMVKKYNSTGDWVMFDEMRGMGMGDADHPHEINSAGEDGSSQNWIDITPTGFKLTNSNGHVNGTGDSYIYTAIRRGPLNKPTDATKVFVSNAGGTGDSPTNNWPIAFKPDMIINTKTDGSTKYLLTRLTHNKNIATDGSNAEGGAGGNGMFIQRSDRLNLSTGWWGGTNNVHAWTWRRAPGFFDVVSYKGDDSSSRAVPHNLGVVPELYVVKHRTANSKDWHVYSAATGNDKELRFNSTTGAISSFNYWANTSPTDTAFYVSDSGNVGIVNDSSGDYLALLFASLDGVSKVGSFSHTNGSDTNVDCGFSSGARFIIIKRTDAASEWYIFDTVRGIVSGNDAALFLNSNAAQQSADWIDPLSSGFTVTGAAWSTGTYLFYAIA